MHHAYLAVDFFFGLSGFVVAYAYDDRWTRMTTWYREVPRDIADVSYM